LRLDGGGGIVSESGGAVSFGGGATQGPGYVTTFSAAAPAAALSPVVIGLGVAAVLVLIVLIKRLKK